MTIDRHLLERASRVFNATADLRVEEDRRINEWFKAQLAASAPCAKCGGLPESDMHYVGTVDSHEYAATDAPSAQEKQP